MPPHTHSLSLCLSLSLSPSPHASARTQTCPPCDNIVRVSIACVSIRSGKTSLRRGFRLFRSLLSGTQASWSPCVYIYIYRMLRAAYRIEQDRRATCARVAGTSGCKLQSPI